MVTVSGLKYVGKAPDSDSSIGTKAYADTIDVSLAVTSGFVNATIAQQTPYLATPAYVGAGDATVAHKTDVDAADAHYVPLTELGQASGVATLDINGNLTSSQVPVAAVTDRPVVYYNATTQGAIYLAAGTTHTVTTETTREFKIASITVADPGYPWYPLCFAMVQGQAGGTDNGRSVGNNNFGQLVVQPSQGVSNTIYAAGIGGSDVRLNYYSLIPYAPTTLPAITPISQPHLTGSMELGLYASCWSGNLYTWSGTGLVYQIMCMPAL